MSANGSLPEEFAHIPARARVLANTLVEEYRKGRLGDRYQALAGRFRTSPNEGADLVLVLARMVALLDPDPDINHVRYLRRMHAEYVRLDKAPQLRTPEIKAGEREYQRRRKRNRRRAA